MTAIKSKSAEKPIIFSTESVRAILEGRKTQTRRVVFKDGDDINHNPWWCSGSHWQDGDELMKCPWKKGQRLWVRETWAEDTPEPKEAYPCDLEVVYRADGDCQDMWWRSPIHMPRWASRITLEVTEVRVERLQKIGKDGRKSHDVLAEGVTRQEIDHQQKFFHPDDSPAIAFAAKWNAINGKKHPWASNPWVWVIAFKRIKP